MSTAADSPPAAAVKVDGVDTAGATVNSPQSRRSLSAPWAQVVRGGGGEPETTTVSPSPEKGAPPEILTSDGLPESDEGGNVGKAKKLVWNKPINGVVVGAVTVMGGPVSSWPALSECTKPSPKSAQDLSKPISDGSTSVSQGPIIEKLPQKQANVNANTNSNANATAPVRPRSMKHRGGSSTTGAGTGGPGGGAFIRAPPPSPPPLPPPFPVMPYGNLVPPVLEPPVVRGPRPVEGFPSQPHAAGDHSPHRNHARRGNFGGRPRGNGSYHNNHRGRPDQDRRDIHPPQFAPTSAGFMPSAPPGTGPFLQHPLVRPFPVPPMGYDMSQFYYGPTLPIINPVPPPPPPLYYPPVDPNLPPALLTQIEYYFSDDNLVKDEFLRLKMDEEGWVPIELIANFRRVKNLTDDIQFILYCLRASTFVEVQGEKVRRRDDWRKWTNTSARFAAGSGSSTPVASTDSFPTSLQNVSLNESATNSSSTTKATSAQVEVAAGGLSDELTNQSNLAQEEEGSTEGISSGQA